MNETLATLTQKLDNTPTIRERSEYPYQSGRAAYLALTFRERMQKRMQDFNTDGVIEDRGVPYTLEEEVTVGQFHRKYTFDPTTDEVTVIQTNARPTKLTVDAREVIDVNGEPFCVREYKKELPNPQPVRYALVQGRDYSGERGIYNPFLSGEALEYLVALKDNVFHQEIVNGRQFTTEIEIGSGEYIDLWRNDIMRDVIQAFAGVNLQREMRSPKEYLDGHLNFLQSQMSKSAAGRNAWMKNSTGADIDTPEKIENWKSFYSWLGTMYRVRSHLEGFRDEAQEHGATTIVNKGVNSILNAYTRQLKGIGSYIRYIQENGTAPDYVREEIGEQPASQNRRRTLKERVSKFASSVANGFRR